MFTILERIQKNNRLIYLDSASTSQKPQQVVDAIADFYTTKNANVGRGIYALAEQATKLYENARQKVADFIGAADASEIVFTTGCTHGINFIAYAWALNHLKPGDEILLSELEHHSNMAPWQMVAQKTGAVLKYIPVHADGTLAMETLDKLITVKTKLVAVVHVSNVIGTHVDVKQIITKAHAVGARVLVDAAQSVPHQKVNVSQMNPDFLVFSGGKMLGPSGSGVLYIKKELHEEVEPFMRGGGMVHEASYENTTFLKAPQKFEAGSPAVAQAVGLAAAIDFLNEQVDFDELQAHEAALCTQLINGLQELSRVRIIGPVDQLKERGHLVSFVVDGIHAHDVAAYLDQFNIAVRAGHHCSQPLAKKLGYIASVRASFYVYSTREDVDALLQAFEKLCREL